MELYDRPANTFVASFIGSPSMNMLEGRVVGGMIEVAGPSWRCLPVWWPRRGRAVIYGMRPEHLVLADAGLSGRVAVIEPTGSETHVVVRTGRRRGDGGVSQSGEFCAGRYDHSCA